MTNQKKHGSKQPVRYIDVCEDCYRMENKIDHIEARGSKFCTKHQCPVTGTGGIKCSMKKKAAEARCSFHFVPVCNVTACKKEAFDKSPHCEAHSCSARGCKKAAKPGEGWDFCDDHKCSDTDCQLPRKKILDKGALMLQSFCRKHECQTKTCTSRKASEKNYCVSHCCTIDTCPDERQGEPLGPLCLEHYNEKIGKDAVKTAEKTAKEKAEKERAEKEKEKAEKEAKKAAEKRRKKEEEEVLSEQSREDRRRRRHEGSPSGSSGLSYDSPPRSRGSDRSRVTKEKKYYYEPDWDLEDDEAYRSSSSTGPISGERYPGHARRRVSLGGLRDEYMRAAYGRGAHKGGW